MDLDNSTAVVSKACVTCHEPATHRVEHTERGMPARRLVLTDPVLHPAWTLAYCDEHSVLPTAVRAFVPVDEPLELPDLCEPPVRVRRRSPRPFILERHHDVSGVSGTGVVAEGVEFADGSVALRWLGEWPTSVVFHERGIESVERIHGHGGATRVVWQ